MAVEKAEDLEVGDLLVTIISLRKQETVTICTGVCWVSDRSLGVENTFVCSKSIGICH